MYLADRGEPRGPHKKAETWEGRGDCVDCNQCVVVCPMGIDIRNGPQIECINCGLCVDACDEIMVRVGRPKGLIAYDTEAAEADRACGRKPKYQFVRSRTIYYGVTLTLVSGLMAWGLSTRSPVVFEALRDRNPTFVMMHDGSVRNGFTLKIDNRSFERREFHVSFAGIAGAQLKTPATPPTSGPIDVIVEPNAVQSVHLLVTAPEQALSDRSLPISFNLTGPKGLTAHVASTFLSGDVSSQ
jgi:cytochrome c oxidase accessory protein FixG